MGEDSLGIWAWVESMLGPPRPVRESKAIHDQVLGTHVFQPHEVAILDTPLLQRLRYVSQTGFVYLTFPGARHTRFEHTIGTAVLVERFERALNCRAEYVAPQDFRELRIAALLHDCGHAFFSHASEDVYRHLQPMKSLKADPKLALKGAGELVSYAIVTSEPFKKFFEQLCADYRVGIDLNNVANYIIGHADSADRAYLAEIVSGPLDVDKLDYIHRDAHATGLRLVVDLERFFYSISVCNADPGRRLAIRSPEPLEQVIFSKMLLFSTVYHHHKVKACDCLLKGAIHLGRDEAQEPVLSEVSDFLQLTDLDFMAQDWNPLVKRLRRRDLLYRAGAISYDTIEPEGSSDLHSGLYQLQQIARDPVAVVDLNRAIYDRLPADLRGRVRPQEIWVDLPELPKLKELSLANIMRFETVVPADKVFPVEGWLNAYSTFRSQGHVFAPRESVARVLETADEVFRERFAIGFKKDLVRSICRLS